jgi:putative transposase
LRFVLKIFEKSRGWYYYRHRNRIILPRIGRPDVVDAIREIIHERPVSYGYRRVHAMLKGKGIYCNHKTVNRYMSQRLWLSSSREKRHLATRRHKGIVATPVPNTRWASDITVIKAWNREKGRFAVLIDCSDRQILSYRFKKNITAYDIQDMVIEAIQNRFGSNETLKNKIEFLSDNGPEYIKKDLKRFLENIGFVVCNTPIRSPESNGIAESFFRGFKRDYVYQSECYSFEAIQDLIDTWVNDYNTKAPHGSLGMLSPVSFYEKWKAENR